MLFLSVATVYRRFIQPNEIRFSHSIIQHKLRTVSTLYLIIINLKCVAVKV